MKSKHERGLIRDGKPVQTWREPNVSGSSRVRRSRALFAVVLKGGGKKIDIGVVRYD